jgi:3-oxoacyl-[acyl-carrier-protein] synthase-3
MAALLDCPPAQRYSRIEGFGAYRPARVVGNDEVCAAIDSSDEWIVSRSGIRTRRFASRQESLIAMAEAAGAAALADAGVGAGQVDGVIVATMSYLLGTPSLAAQVGARLGLPAPAAMDIGAACSGFCYGIGLAGSLVNTGSANRVLLIGAERMTDIVDPADRSTAFLFADGAGAAVIGPSDTPGIGQVAWGSDGSQSDVIRMSHPGAPAGGRDQDPAPTAAPALVMEGPTVYRWAISELTDVARRALKNAGVGAADIDVFVPHQANLRIVESLASSIGLRDDAVCARDVVVAGNTSAASVPLAIQQLRTDGLARPGALALLIGFGAGLAYAAQVVRLP